MNSNQPPALSSEIIDDLRNRYGEPEIPKCNICGGELSVQRAGGGSATIWACSGMIDDPTGERNWVYAKGRSMADDHYTRSRWTDYRRGGDSDVIDLINAYQALAAQPVSQPYKLPNGWKLVPVEPTDEMIAAGDQFMDGLSRLGEAYDAMLAAAPEVE